MKYLLLSLLLLGNEIKLIEKSKQKKVLVRINNMLLIEMKFSIIID
jgi:hypothetical protein